MSLGVMHDLAVGVHPNGADAWALQDVLALGVTAGHPDGAYDDGSGVGLDEVLALDPNQARVITDALALGNEGLFAFAPGETPVLWPEHFDVAIRVGEVNFGVSPGDGFSAVPYAYVGVASRPAGDAFWNAPFGAAVPLRELADAPAVAASPSATVPAIRGVTEPAWAPAPYPRGPLATTPSQASTSDAPRRHPGRGA